jgi:23S rRNA (uridine2552-2'-O)-methyltransferase
LKKNKISKNWLNRQKKDPFIRQSKIQGFRSRSAFKLIEMNEKFKFINKNTNMLDLGSSPGGWSQVASKKINNGKILAIDIKPMEKIENVQFLEADITNFDIYSKIYSYFKKKIDLVISDMAANTTGNKNLDSYRTGELCIKAMDLAQKILNQDGVFLSKFFMGSTFKEIDEKANKCFKKVIKYKPSPSRQESKEIYIYCKGISKV